ncbi:MAG: hypothetical protein M3O23_11560, partial [Actinomycetota bacterium]|nr:hypothetical protein [Actinomycetota bacterium]
MTAAARQVLIGNVVSRVTGLLRVLAVGGALGATYLGNTYQTANLVSNLLFELLAAGLLSSVLVPPFVRLIDAGRGPDAETLAGALLGIALVVLGVVTLAGLLARPWIMRALTVAVDEPEVRRREVELGSFLLVLFLPQVLLYAIGAVATALLHGSRRFLAAAVAPVANNVVVIATMGVFWAIHERSAGLDIPLAERVVLAGGTTGGVVAMTLVPVVALRRAGIRLRPRWRPHHPELRGLVRAGGWAAASLALGQVLIAITLVLANRVEGGVVAYQIAFTAFLLPYAVLAHPVLTTLYPRLAAEAAGRRWRRFADSLGDGVRTVVFLLLPATALLIALAGPALRLVRLGALDDDGAALVARVLAAYAVGLAGYAGIHLLTRASYACDDARTPTVASLAVTAAGAALMVVGFATTTGDDRVVALGVAHSVAMVGGAALLVVLVRRRVGERWAIAAALVRAGGAALAAGLTAAAVAAVVPGQGRGADAVAVVVGGAAGVAAYLAVQWALRAPELARLGRLVPE